jgi:hypothetical protein
MVQTVVRPHIEKHFPIVMFLVEYIFRELTVANNHCGPVGFKSINHSLRPTFLHRANSIFNIHVQHKQYLYTTMKRLWNISGFGLTVNLKIMDTSLQHWWFSDWRVPLKWSLSRNRLYLLSRSSSLTNVHSSTQQNKRYDMATELTNAHKRLSTLHYIILYYIILYLLHGPESFLRS